MTDLKMEDQVGPNEGREPNLRDDIKELREWYKGDEITMRVCDALENALNGGTIIGEIRMEFKGMKIPLETFEFKCGHPEATMDCIDEPNNRWAIICDTCGEQRKFVFTEYLG